MSKYPNSGTLGKNENKRPDKQDPDYNGQAEVDGVSYWLSAWVKTGPSGSKFLSVSFKPKEQQAPRREPPKSGDDFDDDIGF